MGDVLEHVHDLEYTEMLWGVYVTKPPTHYGTHGSQRPVCCGFLSFLGPNDAVDSMT